MPGGAVVSNLLETIRLQVYGTTPERSRADMVIDLCSFMVRHGADTAAQVYAEAYRMAHDVEGERRHEHDDPEPDREWSRD